MLNCSACGIKCVHITCDLLFKVGKFTFNFIETADKNLKLSLLRPSVISATLTAVVVKPRLLILSFIITIRRKNKS